MTEPDTKEELYFIDDIFERLMGEPESERYRVAEDLCGHDAELLAQVLAMLEVEPRAIRPGAVFGKYRFEEKIGEGGSASVWQVFDSDLHKRVALKVFDRAGAGSLMGALQEARASSRVVSDHVVRVHGVGHLYGDDQGPEYIEMELCAESRSSLAGYELVVGTSLADAPPKNHDEAVRAIEQAALGVADAHRVGILHRDIKPANILCRPITKQAQVTDFGLAVEELQRPSADRSQPTDTVSVVVAGSGETIVGTPAFMAPEQANGHKPTEKTDVYGLGATLYALLSGRPPFVAPPGKKRAQGIKHVIRAVRTEAPPRVRQLAPAVPRSLEAVVRKAMERAPESRYGSAKELAEDLGRFLRDRPTTVDKNPLSPPLLYCRRHPRAIATVVGVFVVASLIVGIALSRVSEAERTLEQTQGQIADATAQLVEVRAKMEATETETRRTQHELKRARKQLDENAERAQILADWVGQAHKHGQQVSSLKKELAEARGRSDEADLLREKLQATEQRLQQSQKQSAILWQWLRQAQQQLRQPSAPTSSPP